LCILAEATRLVGANGCCRLYGFNAILEAAVFPERYMLVWAIDIIVGRDRSCRRIRWTNETVQTSSLLWAKIRPIVAAMKRSVEACMILKVYARETGCNERILVN
jgi:hypothetical protein